MPPRLAAAARLRSHSNCRNYEILLYRSIIFSCSNDCLYVSVNVILYSEEMGAFIVKKQEALLLLHKMAIANKVVV